MNDAYCLSRIRSIFNDDVSTGLTASGVVSLLIKAGGRSYFSVVTSTIRGDTVWWSSQNLFFRGKLHGSNFGIITVRRTGVILTFLRLQRKYTIIAIANCLHPRVQKDGLCTDSGHRDHYFL